MSEKVLKSVFTVFAADILALFVMFTLAGSSAFIVRIISAVCGIGVLTAITGSYANKCAEQDNSLKNMVVPAVSVHLSFARQRFRNGSFSFASGIYKLGSTYFISEKQI